MDRMRHLLGRLEGARASDYYGAFKENDRTFVELEPRAMSELTHNLLRGVRYEQVKAAREENFHYLDASLGAKNPLHPHCPEGPYAYPFYCSSGMALKQKLAQRGIFVPTLWPNVKETGNSLERDLAENILPLPIDQRYGSADILRIVTEVVSCLN